MKVVERKDGMIMNLSAGLFFTPHPKGMIVEFPGNQYFIIFDLFPWQLTDKEKVHYCEFAGWPEHEK